MIQQHGGNIMQLRDVIDFSANINPLGIPDKVKESIIDNIADIEKYPDPFCTALIEKIAEFENICNENIVCGNGADDLIFRIVHAIKPKKALICSPTFSEYSRALMEIGCEVHEHILLEDNQFIFTDTFNDKLDDSFDMCFICTPNNPTGQLIQPELLKKLSIKCLENNVILVCDECFLNFTDFNEKYSLKRFINENSIILRAFTKFYALPGIRLGYAVCGDSSVADSIIKSGQFWSVSVLAQRAGIAALSENEYVSNTRKLISDERRFLTDELKKLGVKVFESASNFLLFRSNSGLAERMLFYNILIRDCSNFNGLTEEYYRIAVRKHEENIRFISALRRCLNG